MDVDLRHLSQDSSFDLFEFLSNFFGGMLLSGSAAYTLMFRVQACEFTC